MNTLTNIITVFQILTVLVAFISGFYLITSDSSKRPTAFIGLFLIAFTADTIISLLVNFDVFVGREYLYFLPFNFWFLSSAFLYIYVRELTKPLKSVQKLFHMIPGLVEFVTLTVLFIFAISGVLDMSNLTSWYDGIAYYFEVSVLYALGYYILISWTIRRTRSRLDNEFSNIYGRELKWLEVICYLSILTSVSWVCVSYIESYELFNQLKFIVYIFNMITIGYIIYMSFRQKALNDGSEELFLVNDKLDLVIAMPMNKEENSELNEQQLQDLEKVKTIVEGEKSFLNPDLKIYDIAHLTGYSVQKISQLLNKGEGLNFRRFINSYRIEEAKKMLSSKKFEHLNIDGIAQESGFSSRTTFYSTFKNFTGYSPKEYIGSLED